MTPPTFTCPRCGMTSAHPQDVDQGYCGNCHDWTGDRGDPLSFEDEPPVRAFGEWDAPLTDNAVWLDDVPTDRTCMSCRENFQEGDNGAIMPNNYATHRECHLRSVVGGIGHLVDHSFFCHGELGTDAGLSYRASSLLVWNFYVNKIPCSRESLLLLAGHGPNESTAA